MLLLCSAEGLLNLKAVLLYFSTLGKTQSGADSGHQTLGIGVGAGRLAVDRVDKVIVHSVVSVVGLLAVLTWLDFVKTVVTHWTRDGC